MDKEDVAGRVIHYMALLVPSLVIIYSLLFSTGDAGRFGVYNLVWYGTQSVHAFSLVVVCVSFLVHYSVMKYLMPLVRFVFALSFTLFYIYLGGIFWMVNSYLVRQSGFLVTTFLGFVAITFLIERLDNKHGVLNRYNRPTWVPVVILTVLVLQLVGYVGMWKTGFWELMDVGPLDPNQNPFWVLMRITSFWLLLPLLNRQGMRAPLRLDPKVLIW